MKRLAGEPDTWTHRGYPVRKYHVHDVVTRRCAAFYRVTDAETGDLLPVVVTTLKGARDYINAIAKGEA